MIKADKLQLIKLAHTFIWVFMVMVIFYVLYSGIFNNITPFTWISIGIVIIEGIVLIAFGMSCPLTVLARKYSDSIKDNFDIYLPNSLAKYNKQIFTPLFILGLILVILRVI